MISAISSVTQAQPVAQPAGTSTQNTGQPTPQSGDGGGDSVHLSRAAQDHAGQQEAGCSGH
jgi:hypothetical protein